MCAARARTMTKHPADTDTETEEPELRPDEAARLVEAARRAEADLAAGRIYRTSEASLKALLAEARRRDRPARSGGLGFQVTPEAKARGVITWAVEAGLLERERVEPEELDKAEP